MDNRGFTGKSIVISVPPSLGIVDGIERQDPVTRTPSRNCCPYSSTEVVISYIRIMVLVVLSVLGVVVIVIQMGIKGVGRVAGVVLLLPFAFLSFLASEWIGVFILSCVAVSFDSLFLYIPIIDQENKCLDTDKTLRNVALILRSLTDIAFIFHIGALINGSMGEGHKWVQHADSLLPRKLQLASWFPRKLQLASWFPRKLQLVRPKNTAPIHTIVNFLAILPNPQVAIVVGSFRLGIIIVLLVFQYLLRIFQMLLSIKKVGGAVGKLVKGSFYFLLYIIASYVFAAFWYFFSIQRETSCWDQACQTIAGCMPIYDCSHSTVYDYGHSTLLNSTFLNKLCPIESPNETLFDFGMFRDILKSGITGSTNFSTKFFYTFWWGLKNLSNFGTDLETSSYIWENCFAILICVIGLLLFLLLIGKVQIYIQSESKKFVKFRESRRESRRMVIDKKRTDIKMWMSNHGIPDDMRSLWIDIEEDYLKRHIDEDVNAFFMHDCPSGSNALSFVCVKALKNIPILRKLDKQHFKVFLDVIARNQRSLIVVEKDGYITRAGNELRSMYLIIDGVIECKVAETMSTQTMRRHDCCGEEVLRWAILNYEKRPRCRFPISTVDIKCQTKTEAFEFTADDLIEIVEKLNGLTHLLESVAHDSSTEQRIEEWLLRNGFPEDLKGNIRNFLHKNNRLVEENTDADVDVDFLFGILPNNIKSSIKRHLGMNALKKVSMLQKMHEYVLEIICNHLQPVVYKMNTYVVRAGEPLGFMIFILRGKIIMTNERTSSNATTTRSSEISESCDDKILRVGDSYGEQLLSWASPNNISSSDNPVISTRDVKCQTKVEALILKAEDLRSAVSKCGSQWNFNDSTNSQHLVGYGKDTVADTGASASTSPNNEQTIQLHQGHDMLLQQLILIRETVFQLRNDMSTQGRRLDDQGRRLDEMAVSKLTLLMEQDIV